MSSGDAADAEKEPKGKKVKSEDKAKTIQFHPVPDEGKDRSRPSYLSAFTVLQEPKDVRSKFYSNHLNLPQETAIEIEQYHVQISDSNLARRRVKCATQLSLQLCDVA